jgi:hypothetical protein
MKKLGIAAIGTGAVVVCIGLGLGVGSAIAGGPWVYSPAGLSPSEGIESVPQPEPTYSVNADGQSYGSALDATSPDNEPDLIAVIATNGREGYALKKDMDDANGTTAMKDFKSPEDALKWQEEEGWKEHSIPVYLEDGRTVVGEFVIGG